MESHIILGTILVAIFFPGIKEIRKWFAAVSSEAEAAEEERIDTIARDIVEDVKLVIGEELLRKIGGAERLHAIFRAYACEVTYHIGARIEEVFTDPQVEERTPSEKLRLRAVRKMLTRMEKAYHQKFLGPRRLNWEDDAKELVDWTIYKVIRKVHR